MFCTYVLRSEKDNKLYIGHAKNLEERLRLHNLGKVQSTRHRIPFQIVYSKSFATRSEARWQERKWKSGWGHKQLKTLIPQFKNQNS